MESDDHSVVVRLGILALMAAVFAALTSILAKVGIEGVDSDLATLIRTLVVLIALGIFVLATSKWTNPFSLRPKTLTFLVLSGLATCASWVCYFRALQMGEASKVAPIDKSSVVLVAIFAVLFLGERPVLKDWFGIILVGLGTIVLALR